MPLSPEWAKLPKRHCDDCGKLYKQVRPRREGEMGFCSDNCRKSYHKHGGAYRKLKAELEKLQRRQLLLEKPCEVCNGRGTVRAQHWGMASMTTPGVKVASVPCSKCINGAVLTAFGREVLDFIERRTTLKDRPIPAAAEPGNAGDATYRRSTERTTNGSRDTSRV